MRLRFFIATTAGALSFLAATSLVAPTRAEDESASTATVSAEKLAEAKEIFRARCVLCHGEAGKGDGAGAVAFDPRPRDLSDPAWQHSVSDEHIEKIILLGGTGVGKSPMMPPNPDLQGRAEVVKALRQVVRGLEKK